MSTMLITLECSATPHSGFREQVPTVFSSYQPAAMIGQRKSYFVYNVIVS
jgi:hypothetical protein